MIRNNDYDNLSKKQKVVYDVIVNYCNKNGYPPSIREICDLTGIKSTSTVHGYMERLKKKGLIQRQDAGKPRAFTTSSTFDKKETIHIPVFSISDISENLDYTKAIDTLPLAANFLKHERELFCTIIPDNSLEKKGIYKGDFAIFEKRNILFNSNIGAFIVKGEVYIREFNMYEQSILLKSYCNYNQDIETDEFITLGRLVNIYRKI